MALSLPLPISGPHLSVSRLSGWSGAPKLCFAQDLLVSLLKRRVCSFILRHDDFYRSAGPRDLHFNQEHSWVPPSPCQVNETDGVRAHLDEPWAGS